MDDLIRQAAEFGLTRADVATAARYHFGSSELERLFPEQIDTLYERLMVRYGMTEEVMELEMPATNGNGANGSSRKRKKDEA